MLRIVKWLVAPAVLAFVLFGAGASLAQAGGWSVTFGSGHHGHHGGHHGHHNGHGHNAHGHYGHGHIHYGGAYRSYYPTYCPPVYVSPYGCYPQHRHHHW